VLNGYSFIHVISYIPANLAGAFDPLKNGIADGSIGTPVDFADKLAEFMCSFFDFTFFDIHYAIVGIRGELPVSSSGLNMEELNTDPGKIEEFALSIDETTYFGKVTSGLGEHHIYVTPLIFGDKRLGYIASSTKKKLWRMFIHLMNEFENDFVDDQIVHVMEGVPDTIS